MLKTASKLSIIVKETKKTEKMLKIAKLLKMPGYHEIE